MDVNNLTDLIASTYNVRPLLSHKEWPLFFPLYTLGNLLDTD